MKVVNIEEYTKMANPVPGKLFSKELFGSEKDETLGGIFSLLEPGIERPYHFHRKRESVIFVIRGEGAMLVEGKEVPIKAFDVVHIYPGEKHQMLKKAGNDIRYIEVFTCPPVPADYVKVE